MSDRVFLTAEEALAMLPDGEYIHVLDNPHPGVISGADWKRDDVLSLIENNICELAGPMATSMGHGLAVGGDDGVWFVQTKEE